MKTREQILAKLDECKMGLLADDNTYNMIAWQCSINALNWVIAEE